LIDKLPVNFFEEWLSRFRRKDTKGKHVVNISQKGPTDQSAENITHRLQMVCTTVRE